MQKTYTVTEIAKILKIRKNYVYDMIYAGRIKAIRLSERRFRITEDSLSDFLRQEEGALTENISVYSGYQPAMEVDANDP